jgi:Fur family ferric uptake transcriptional regulator
VTQVGPDAVQALVTALAENHGFETDVGHLTVFGRCAECQQAGPGGHRARTPHHPA